MKIVVIKSENDPFEKARRLLDRELTPRERKWLILADEMLKKTEKPRVLSRTRWKAA
jgi:hypothetical protein